MAKAFHLHIWGKEIPSARSITENQAMASCVQTYFAQTKGFIWVGGGKLVARYMQVLVLVHEY